MKRFDTPHYSLGEHRVDRVVAGVSCFNRDQPLDRVDFKVLRERLSQNSVQEKLTAAWIDRCLKQLRYRAAAE